MLYDNIKNSAMIVENYETTKMEWLFVEPMISEEMYTELLSISGPDRAARLVDIFNNEEIIGWHRCVQYYRYWEKRI